MGCCFWTYSIFNHWKNINIENSKQVKVQEFDLFSGVTIRMIWVEPETFIMGSPNDEIGWTPEREKEHEVNIFHRWILVCINWIDTRTMEKNNGL